MSGLIRSTPLLLSGEPTPIDRRSSAVVYGGRTVRVRNRDRLNDDTRRSRVRRDHEDDEA